MYAPDDLRLVLNKYRAAVRAHCRAQADSSVPQKEVDELSARTYEVEDMVCEVLVSHVLKAAGWKVR